MWLMPIRVFFPLALLGNHHVSLIRITKLPTSQRLALAAWEPE